MNWSHLSIYCPKSQAQLKVGLRLIVPLIAIHNGKEAGQEIPHLHIHVVPRKKGDGGGPIHSCFRSGSSSTDRNLNEIFRKLKTVYFSLSWQLVSSSVTIAGICARLCTVKFGISMSFIGCCISKREVCYSNCLHSQAISRKNVQI